MDIEHLRTFIAVWRSRSFTGAADELGVAPSSVSRAIAALEEALGVRLFQRTTRAMQPTEGGKRLFVRAEQILDEWDSMREAVASEADTVRGTLRVSSSVAFGKLVIAPLLPAIAREHPDLQIELVLSDERLNLVEEQIDLAIRHGQMPDSSLVARKLADVRYQLVSSPQIAADCPLKDDPDRLRSAPIVAFSFGDFRREWVFRKADDERAITIAPAITASNALVVAQAAIAGAGYALLADWMIADDLASGRLVKALPDWVLAGSLGASELWLVYPSRSFVPRKTRVFAELLEREFSRIT